ncbi:aminoglycoside phosphotransferase [Kribbella sp. NPDC023855]|uniref:aminoglycoside phosphotransferase n=1 Tax=Kribbella sp. NPDC023855 TaxID=3154698 RepID=UPI0034025494
MRSSDSPVTTTPLLHNPLNKVTGGVARVTDERGNSVIRKELRRPTGQADAWAASGDPRHWNYWHREVDVYRDVELRTALGVAGLVLPAAEVHEHEAGATLRLQDVAGRSGTEFTLEDHGVLARGVGNWQARAVPARPWTSRGFLRAYAAIHDVPWHLLDDDDAWRHPLVRQWPATLRAGWVRMVAHRADLLTVIERLPRTWCHLDLWVSNVIRRPAGDVALLDWSFTGDGALGEDIGNYIPDAALDLFWPAERLPELADAVIHGYLTGLRDAGWHGSEDLVRLGVHASAVKYVWLLPLQLSRAADPVHRAYHRQVDSEYLYDQRGQVFALLAEWADRALTHLQQRNP